MRSYCKLNEATISDIIYKKFMINTMIDLHYT